MVKMSYSLHKILTFAGVWERSWQTTLPPIFIFEIKSNIGSVWILFITENRKLIAENTVAK